MARARRRCYNALALCLASSGLGAWAPGGCCGSPGFGGAALSGLRSPEALPRVGAAGRWAASSAAAASSLLLPLALPSLDALRSRFPGAPEEELRRFARARPKSEEAALRMYEEHVRWRRAEGAAERLAEAAAGAPRRWAAAGGEAKDGTMILFVQGARYDLSTSPESHTSAICHTIDSMLPPEVSGQLTVLVDVRSGVGWPNPPAAQLLPFFRDAARVIPDHFPERLRRLVVYPLPQAVTVLVGLILALLDSKTRAKLCLLLGPSNEGAPCPADGLRQFVSKEGLPEHARAMHDGL